MLQHNKILMGWTSLLFALGAALVAGCTMSGKEAPKAGTYEGPATAIGQGEGRAFVTLDADGKPTRLGIRLTEGALSGLPPEPPQVGEWAYELALPAEAAGAGYDHVTMDWNPHGHIPQGVYDIPHFDFHFYLVGNEVLSRITASGEDLERAHKQPPEGFMPEGYILPPGTEVPGMGAHAIDPAGDEFNHKPFTKTFIYGFYDGEMIFVEPMISLDYLGSSPMFSEAVKLPKTYTFRAYYPTSYGITYDSDRRWYEITLDGLVAR